MGNLLGVEGIPGWMANELAGINDPAEIQAKLFEEVRRVRKETVDGLRKLADPDHIS